MGPGYFPTILAGLLIVFGVIALARSFVTQGERLGALAWKPLLIILSSMIIFGLLLERAGLVIALVVLIFGSATASSKFRFEFKASLLALALVGGCVLVFVLGLGLPMPLLGSWF